VSRVNGTQSIGQQFLDEHGERTPTETISFRRQIRWNSALIIWRPAHRCSNECFLRARGGRKHSIRRPSRR
jgi:hypothetical protein